MSTVSNCNKVTLILHLLFLGIQELLNVNRCEQTKNRCIVREKARPRRARRVVGRPENANTSKLGGDDTGSPISSTPSHSGDLSSKEGDFSLDLPTTIYHDPSKDAEILQNHHKQMFKNDNSRSPTPSKEAIHQPGPSKHISARRLTLPQATHLLKSYIPKLPFFPFVTLPTNPSIPLLSQQSPFLLLAILTVAAIPHPYLHHQLDQEFRRVLSLKLIVESQKSLDYLMGLLVYVAWYPVHTKPKNNPCFTYMNLANSLALDLGLDHAEPQTNVFEGVDFRGLVGEDGTEGWTEDARKAYMGCYVLGSQSVISISSHPTSTSALHNVIFKHWKEILTHPQKPLKRFQQTSPNPLRKSPPQQPLHLRPVPHNNTSNGHRDTRAYQ